MPRGGLEPLDGWLQASVVPERVLGGSPAAAESHLPEEGPRVPEPAMHIPYVAGAWPRSSPFEPRAVAVPDQGRDGTTLFHCGGCGTAARFAHDDQRYGRLVHRFLDRHGRCDNAVEIMPGSSPSAQSRPADKLVPATRQDREDLTSPGVLTFVRS